MSDEDNVPKADSQSIANSVDADEPTAVSEDILMNDKNTEAERALEEMIDIQWNTNWSDLPAEAERHVEKAYEHLMRAEEFCDDDGL